MNIEFQNNFTVMPKHTNYMYPMIFGGEFFSKIDLCAAACVRRALHDSECQSAVTHMVNVKFLKPCYVGDLIYIKSNIVEARTKSIKVKVIAEREKRDSDKRDVVAEGELVFVSVLDIQYVKDKPDKLPYASHNLKL